MPSAEKYATLLLKAAFTVGALAWLLYKIGGATLIEAVRNFPAKGIAVAAILVTLQAFVASIRWHLILRYLGAAIPFTRSMQVYWIGMFATTLLPGGVAGDGLRIWVLARSGMVLARSVNAVVLDRLAALAGLILLTALGLPWVNDRIAPGSVRLAIAAALLLGLATAFALGLWMPVPQRWLRFRPVGAIVGLLADFRTLCKSSFRAADLICLSMASLMLGLFAIFVLFGSLGASVGVVETITLGSLVILAITLPISLGGWGLREGTMVGLFGIIGIPPATSLAVSVVLGLLTTAISVPGLAIWMRWRHEPIQNLPEAARPAVEAEGMKA